MITLLYPLLYWFCCKLLFKIVLRIHCHWGCQYEINVLLNWFEFNKTISSFIMFACLATETMVRRCNGGVRCSCVRHAILSLRTLLHILCNRVRGYAKTVRWTYTTVHVCARVSERAFTEIRIWCAWMFTYFIMAANTQRPNISHVIHEMH